MIYGVIFQQEGLVSVKENFDIVIVRGVVGFLLDV